MKVLRWLIKRTELILIYLVVFLQKKKIFFGYLCYPCTKPNILTKGEATQILQACYNNGFIFLCQDNILFNPYLMELTLSPINYFCRGLDNLDLGEKNHQGDLNAVRHFFDTTTRVSWNDVYLWYFYLYFSVQGWLHWQYSFSFGRYCYSNVTDTSCGNYQYYECR